MLTVKTRSISYDVTLRWHTVVRDIEILFIIPLHYYPEAVTRMKRHTKTKYSR